MKALSIKQPYASLIVHDIKDIENRTWKTNFRGRIYIHSTAKAMNDFDFTKEQVEVLAGIDTDNMDFLNSAIIGEVDIIDCVINHSSIWAEKSEYDNYDDEAPKSIIYNWVLANPVLYHKPILNVKGKLSFWEFDK